MNKQTGDCLCLETAADRKPKRLEWGQHCSRVPVDVFCKKPAVYLCQNRQAEAEAQAMKEYETAKKWAMTSLPVEAIFEKLPEAERKEKLRHLREGNLLKLDTIEQQLVSQRMNDSLEKNFFMKNDRIPKAKKIFEHAKKAMLAYLKDRLKQEASPRLQAMLELQIAEIEKTTPVVGWMGASSDGVIPHNAGAFQPHGVTPPGSRPGAPGQTANFVLIGGLIQQVDYAPESLYVVMLHELAHFLDPQHFKNISKDEKDYPFQTEIKCLRAQDTIGAKYAFRDHKDQINEAFADWLAMQAWHKDYRERGGIDVSDFKISGNVKGSYYSAPILQSNTSSRGNWPHPLTGRPVSAIDTTAIQRRLLTKLLELTALPCADYRANQMVCGVDRDNNPDCHPIGEDRVNFQLASPELKSAMGCPEEYIKVRKPGDPTANSAGDIVAHCPASPTSKDKGETVPHNPLRRR